MTDPDDEPAPRARPRPSKAAGDAVEAVEAVEASGPDPVDETEPPTSDRRGMQHRWSGARAPGSRRAGLIAAVAGLAAVAVAAVVVVSLVGGGSSGSTPTSATVSEPQARLTSAARTQAFVAGATSDVLSVTSYSYRTLQSDLDNGLAVTTGAYRDRYRAALTGSLGATARRLHRTQTFQLATAGIGRTSADGSSAHVLLFGTQGVQDDTTGGHTQDSLVTLDATIRRQGDSYLISGLDVGGDAGLPAGTTGLTAAAEAARSEVAALLTMRRAHLATDSRAVVATTVGPLHSQLTTQAASVRRAVTKGGYDLTGEVTALAVRSADGDTATLLVAATGDRTTASGRSSVATDGRYAVTVVRVQGRWLVSALDPVAVQD